MGEKQARVAYGLLAGAGWLGAHRFYLQRYASAAGQLALAVVMLLLWIWGGSYAGWAKYLLAPIFFWLLHDAFWLFDYFRVMEDMDSRLAAFQDSAPADDKPSRVPARAQPKAAAPVANALLAVPEAEALPEDDKKARAIKLARRQITTSIQENHPEAANVAAQRLVQYLQQRSRRPQNDVYLAQAYLIQGAALFQTEYLDAARKKLHMGVHLAQQFAQLQPEVQRAQLMLDNLRNPARQPSVGQYEALMRSGDWQQAAHLCGQTIALRESAKTIDVADLALHRLRFAEIQRQLGHADEERQSLMVVLELAKNTNQKTQASLLPAETQRQALERLGDMDYGQGQHSSADSHYRDALALAATQQLSPTAICGLLQRMALNFERAGDADKALRCWNSAAQHIAKLGDVLVDDSEAVSDVLTRYAAFSIRHQPAQVKPLIEQSLRLQHRTYRGYSLAAARAYEVFASFMADIDQPQARIDHLKQALLLYDICDPDNTAHMHMLKTAINTAQAALLARAATAAPAAGVSAVAGEGQ